MVTMTSVLQIHHRKCAYRPRFFGNAVSPPVKAPVTLILLRFVFAVGRAYIYIYIHILAVRGRLEQVITCVGDSDVRQSRNICCATQQTCLLLDTEDRSDA